jgi:hypothetical protein
MKRWTERLQMDVTAQVDDQDIQFAIAFILDALADTEDDCGHLEMIAINEYQIKLHKLVLDKELEKGLVDRCGPKKVTAAVDWLCKWMLNAKIRNTTVPLWWLGWRLGGLVIADQPKEERFRIEVNHVVVDFKEGRTLGVTLWDKEDIFCSTILPFPSWKLS